jgi:hypothetical protein
MRARYPSVSAREVSVPAAMRSRPSVAESSTTSRASVVAAFALSGSLAQAQANAARKMNDVNLIGAILQ